MKKTLFFIFLSLSSLFAQAFNAPMQSYMQDLSTQAKVDNSAFSGFHDAGPQEPCIQKSKIILLKCYG